MSYYFWHQLKELTLSTIVIYSTSNVGPDYYDVNDPQHIIAQYNMCLEAQYPGPQVLSFTTNDGRQIHAATQHIRIIELLLGS